MMKIFTKWQFTQMGRLLAFLTLSLLPLLGQAQIVISQVYGGGGNSGATYRNDFVEFYNNGATDQSLSGYTLAYNAANGNTGGTVTLSGTVMAGKYFLLQLASSGAVGGVLPAPDYTGTLNLAAASGTATLLQGTTIIDRVGYGTALLKEGTATAALSATTSAKRTGNTDTNDNSADFTVGAPTPRNSTPENTALTITNGTFANAEVNTTTSTAVFTFSNSGSTAQTITPSTSGAPFSVPATAVVVPAASNGVAGTATVTVTFTPTAQGTFTGTLTAAVAGLQPKVSAQFSATGVAPATFPNISVSQGATTYPDAGTTPYNFGNQAQGTTSSPVTFTISNSSTTNDLTVSGIVVTSTSNNYALSSTAPTAASPITVPKRTGGVNGTATFSITFTPSTTGTRTGTVTITNTSASPTNSYTFSLTGNGTAVAPAITATSLATNELLIGVPTVVVINGTNFSTASNATSVAYSNGTVTALTVSSSTTLRATITAAGAGNLTVSTTTGGSSAALALTAAAPPTTSLFEPFESVYLTSYASDPTVLTLSSGAVTVGETLLSTSTGPFTEKRSNSQSARLRGNGYIQFSRATGAGTISFQAASFGTDGTSNNPPTFILSYSLDGADFVTVGGTPAAGMLAAALTTYTYQLNAPSNVRVRISNSTTSTSQRINIDNVTISDFNSAVGNLTVANNQTNGGIFNNVTIRSGGVLTLSSNLTVNGALVIENGGTLNVNSGAGCFTVSGPGTFTLQDGGTLAICDPAGISLTSTTTGAVRVTGARTFSTDASYVYNNGNGPQNTGDGLPATVRNLTASTGDGLSLNQAVAVTQVARITSAGMISNGLLTLRSSQDATEGTALLVDENGTTNVGGAVVGDVNVERAITRTGDGYRHLSAPISNATVNSLRTNEFSPVVNPAYNTSAQPRAEKPFPTVYSYDESRLATAQGLFVFDFDKGFKSPTDPDLQDPLLPGLGYDVQTPATTFTFTGPVNNGDFTLPLVNSGTSNSAQAGYNMVGNPYPSPLDLSNVSISGAADRSIYTWISNGKYTGTYRVFLRNANGTSGGIASGTPSNTSSPSIVALGQAFFMRVPAAGAPAAGSLALTNADRVTTFTAADGAYSRGVVTSQQKLTLTLTNAAGTRADQTAVYFADLIPAGIDGRYDAYKLPNSGDALNLSTVCDNRELAINGLPLPAAGQLTLVPLAGSVPQLGSFRLSADELNGLAAGTVVALHDGLTGTRTPLTVGTSYTFSTNTYSLKGRFTLEFGTGSVLGTAGQALAAQVSLYPNPAKGSFTLALPALKDKVAATATLSNSLGQTVRQLVLPAKAAGQAYTFQVDIRSLPAGIYQLHLTIGQQQVVRRVVVE
jgi:hypothetical protein